MEHGPTVPYCQELHARKYRGPGEDFRGYGNRVANHLKDDDGHYLEFRDALLDMRFMPGGRIQSACGSLRQVTAYNCLSGDTPILTREHGVVPIRDVAGQEVTLLDGDGNWVRCPVVDHGEQVTYAVTFKGGFETVEVRSTLHHGWIKDDSHFHVVLTGAFTSPSGKVRLADLRPGKVVVDEVEHRRGVVHGLVYGDGSCNGVGHTLGVFSHAESHLPWLAEFSSSPTEFNTVLGHAVGVSFYIPKAYAGTGSLKELPEAASVSNDYLLGFLRGWFAADGCVSTQPAATIACGDEEYAWLRQWAPVVGWQILGRTRLADETNLGTRKKTLYNAVVKKQSLSMDDLLIDQHRERWMRGHCTKQGFCWHAHGAYHAPRMERVYCPVVPTTHSFALGAFIHSRNCFVSGAIHDSFVHGSDEEGFRSSIMGRTAEAATTMRMGGGIGYDFSTLRPRGGLIEGLQSRSCGPLGFMPIYSAVALATSSTDHRRGAQMGVLRVDHPDIEEFVRAKNNATELRGFNLSIAVTHEFMEAKAAGRPFPLRFEGRTYKTVDPPALWELIMRSTWDYAEPGVLFIDTINDWNNLWYCETISATNPCGEQPLPPFGACLLGSFNLTRYVVRLPGGSYWFDYDRLAADVPAVIRAMDNVVDRTIYPLERQRLEAHSKRRMGIGYTGLANAGEALGHPYGSPGFLAFERLVGETITHSAYRASVALAEEKGAFPLFDADRYLQGRFVRALPDDIQWGIRRHGIRNSHLTSIAPTGTISLAADNVSSGLEPVFNYRFTRTEQRFNGPEEMEVEDYGVRVFGVRGRRCAEVTAEEHVAVLAEAQRTTDSACSKTCNVDPSMPWERFKGIYDAAYEMGCKGVTTYNPEGKRPGVLVSMEDPGEGPSCELDAETGRRSCE